VSGLLTDFISKEDRDWMDMRGIPYCISCTFHLMEKPEIKKRFRITDNHGEAQAYFAFYHLSHGKTLAGLFR
jgi:hypothetical protein